MSSKTEQGLKFSFLSFSLFSRTWNRCQKQYCTDTNSLSVTAVPPPRTCSRWYPGLDASLNVLPQLVLYWLSYPNFECPPVTYIGFTDTIIIKKCMECYFPCIRDLDTATASGATFSHGFTCNTSSAKILAVSFRSRTCF